MMKTFLIFSFLIVQAQASTLHHEFSKEQRSFLDQAQRVGFEELDPNCKDCESPDRLLEKLKTIISEYPQAEFQNDFNSTIEKYVGILKKLKTKYHNDGKKTKFAKASDSKITQTMDDYISQVSTLHRN